jgi:hypothetical protein
MTTQESTAAAIGGIPVPTALEDALLASAQEGRPGIATVDDAIRHDAALAAVVDVATGRRAQLKAWVGEQLGRPGAKAAVDGIGKALVTDPQTRAQVVDDQAFRAWALRTHPDRTDTVDRVRTGVIERALAGDMGDDLAARLAALLDEIPGAVETEVVVDAKLADDVAKPAVARELDDGRLVVKETGEIIPGVELGLASSPSPRVTPDKGYVAELADRIAGSLPDLPALAAQEAAE